MKMTRRLFIYVAELIVAYLALLKRQTPDVHALEGIGPTHKKTVAEKPWG